MKKTAALPASSTFDPLRVQLLAAAEAFATDARPLGDLLAALVDDVRRAADEPLEIFPVCHHSPAAAVHMIARLRRTAAARPLHGDVRGHAAAARQAARLQAAGGPASVRRPERRLPRELDAAQRRCPAHRILRRVPGHRLRPGESANGARLCRSQRGPHLPVDAAGRGRAGKAPRRGPGERRGSRTAAAASRPSTGPRSACRWAASSRRSSASTSSS